MIVRTFIITIILVIISRSLVSTDGKWNKFVALCTQLENGSKSQNMLILKFGVVEDYSLKN